MSDKKEFLTKHCITSKNGIIALSNTLVEMAIKLYNCPIKVSCVDYPGEISVYTVEDLLIPKFTAGPYPNRYEPGSTYSLCMYTWKGEPATQEELDEVWTEMPLKEKSIDSEEVIIEKKGKGYVIKTPVVVTTYEEKEVSLTEYVGMIIHQTRTSRGLTQNALSNLTNNKVSATSISQIETATTNPILSSLEVICEALGLHITDLFPPKN
jgi:DNA-binding XRE family transcriptional regulator